MNIQEAKTVLSNCIKYTLYEDFGKTEIKAVKTIIAELDNKDKQIEELKEVIDLMAKGC